jgi:hypothetical protein
LPELVAARPDERPSFIARDLAGLLQPHPDPPSVVGGEVTLGGWRGRVVAGRLEIDGHGTADDWWRVVAITAWTHRDREGGVPDTTGLVRPGAEVAR